MRSLRVTCKITAWGIIWMLLLVWINTSTAQVTLYSENFTYTNGTTFGSGNPEKWSRNLNGRTPATFSVQNNVFEAKNTGGEVIWQSQVIYIQDWEYVSVKVDMPLTIDKMEADDYINFYYKLNGGSETLFSTNGNNVGNFAAGRVASQEGLSGNTLQIIVRIKNNANDEEHFFDNVIVTGYPYVYFENFNTYANGTTTSTKWSINGSANVFSVQNGEFQYRNSSQAVTWSSSVVDISGYSNVSLYVTLRENSTNTLENSDWIEVLYKLNGGSETRFATNGYFADDFPSPYTFTASQTGLSGSTVQIIIKMKTNANDEIYYFDDIIVSGSKTPASITISTSKNNVLCHGASTGAVSITNITGGRAPFTFSWSNGATTQNLSNVTAGTYTVTVTSHTGATATASQTITQPASGFSYDISYSNYNGARISCHGASDGAIYVTVSGNTSPYTYAWSTGANTSSISGRPAGTYTLTVTDANGCTGSTSATLTQPAAVSGSIVKTNISCLGQTDGTATLTPSGGTTPYTFLWTGGATSQNRTGLATGTYSVTITDANGCTGTATTTLNNPLAMSVTVASHTNVLCHGQHSGAINITATGGTAPLTYTWSNGANTEDLHNIPAGTYTVTVTANGNSACTVSTTQTITQPASPLQVSETVKQITCHNDNNGSITLTASGGTGTKSFQWSGGSTASSRTLLSAGNYTYTVSDANGCSVSNTITITNPQPLTLSFSITHQTNELLPNGAIDLTVSGGWSPYSYLWNKKGENITTQDRTNLQSGWHSVTVTDAEGCKTTKAALLVLYDTIRTGSFIINMGVTPQTIANGLKPYGMIYDLVRNYKIPIKWAINPNKSKDGIDFTHNGINYRGSAFIIEEEYLDNNIINRINYWMSIGVVGAYTISNFVAPVYGVITGFSNLGIDQANENLVIPYFNNAGIPSSIYYVGLPQNLDACEDAYILPHADPTWNDHKYLKEYVQTGGFLWTGCHAVSILENLANPSDANNRMNFLSKNGLQCYKSGKCGNVSEVHAGTHTSPATYNALFDAHPIMQFMGDLVPTTNNGSETWYIPLSNGGWNSGAARAITTNNGSAGREGVKLVFGYGFDDKDNGLVMYQAGHTAHGKGTIAEQVAAQRAFFNFILYSSIFNKVYATITAPDTIAEGGTVTLTASAFDGTPPYSYQWSTNVSGSFSHTHSPTTQFTLNTGNGRTFANVSVKVTDACGRHFFYTKPFVVQYMELSETRISNYNGYNISCHGGNDGYIMLHVNGGVPPYTFQWSNGATTRNISGLSAGTYYVTITDALNGILRDTFTLIQPNALSVSLSGTASLPCYYTATGTINSSISGGVSPYSYIWSSGNTTAHLSNATPGMYSLAVTDANGCYATQSHTIAAPDSILINYSITNVSCYNGTNGSIHISVTGGTGSKTYAWSNGANTQNINSLAANDYSVTVTDAAGCTATETIPVDQPDELILTVHTTPISCHNAEDGAVMINATGGTAPIILYNFDGPVDTIPVSYTNVSHLDEWYWVEDANGCFDGYEHVKILNPEPIILSHSVQGVTCSGTPEGSIQITISETAATPVNYLWSNGANTKDIENLTDGNYRLTTTDNNGCIDSIEIVVNATSKIISSMTVTDESATNANDGSITQTVSGGISPYSYHWSNGAHTKNISNLSPGNYTVTITDSLGCSITQSAYVSAYFSGKYWVGSVSIAWDDPNNWSPPGIPTAADTVVIPASAVRMPTIGANVSAVCNLLELKEGAILTMTTTSTLTIYGDLILNGTFVHGNGRVRFFGQQEQNYYANKKHTFFNVTFNNSSETGVKLHRSLVIANNIAFADGLVFTGNDTIFCTNSNANSITQHSDTSFVVGRFNRAITQNTYSYFFPLGRYVNGEKKQFHCEIINNNLQGVSNITAYFDHWPPGEVLNITYVDLGTDAVVERIYPDGRWVIEPDRQPTSGTYSIKLYIQNFSNIDDNFVILKRPHNGSSSQWNTGNGRIPGKNQPGRTIQHGYGMLTNLTTFSDFGAGGGGGNGLPVKLVEFTGKPWGDHILLEWKTMTEINNDYFTIERSNNASHFHIIGTVMGAGNSSVPLKYSLTDYESLEGINYYRLKQTDFDGRFTYHKTIAVNNNKSASLTQIFNLFPNPNNGNFEIEFESKTGEESRISIINAAGSVVKTYQVPFEKGIKKIVRCQLHDMLVNGVYTIIIDDGEQRHFKKMTVQKP